jgi:cytidylate kinase
MPDTIKQKNEDLHENVHQKQPPVVIAMARDYGADGHEIGIALSWRLGIPLYDNELLVRASLRLGTSVDQLAMYDEQVAAEMMAFLPDRFDTRTAADKLFDSMRGVIQDLGLTESCIIEGRLADYILRGNRNLISVLVTAPFEDRVKRVKEKRDIDDEKAKKLVKKMQKNREQFYKRYSNGQWKLRSGKDLVVNRGKFSRDSCCEIIARAYEAKCAEVGATLPTPVEVPNVPTQAEPLTQQPTQG